MRTEIEVAEGGGEVGRALLQQARLQHAPAFSYDIFRHDTVQEGCQVSPVNVVDEKCSS